MNVIYKIISNFINNKSLYIGENVTMSEHMIQAAMAMEQRSRFAARRAKDPSKKKSLSLANKVYKGYINKLKKRTIALRKKKK